MKQDLIIQSSEFKDYSERHICIDIHNRKIFLKISYIYIDTETQDVESHKSELGWNEIYLCKLISEFNFPFIYKYRSHYIEKCLNTNVKKLGDYECKYKLNFLSEYVDNSITLSKFLQDKKQNLTFMHLKIILFQIFYSIIFLQTHNIVHGDLHENNILVHKEHSEHRFYSYKIGNDIYYMNNINIFIKIIDFNLSFQPGYCQNDRLNDILNLNNQDLKKIDFYRALGIFKNHGFEYFYNDYISKLNVSNDSIEFFRLCFYDFTDRKSPCNTINIYSI